MKIKAALAWLFLPQEKGYPGLLYIPGYVVIFIFLTPWLIFWIPYCQWKLHRQTKELGERAERILASLRAMEQEDNEIKNTLERIRGDDQHNLN